jgi:membrane protein implicated in regulation of membrane protease activity
MDAPLAWILAGLGLVIAELMSGTFYLLVLGLAALAAGAGAYLGVPFEAQVAIAVVAAIAGLAWVYRWRKRGRSTMPPLDLGQSVTLDSWVDRSAGMARVKYRDALWDARVEGECRGEPGEIFTIRALRGSTLTVAARRTA